MAECFQSDAESILEKSRKETEQISSSSLEKSLLQKDFTLITLYQSFMDTKRRVFCEEKTNTSTSNPIVNYALNFLIKRIERELTKLAIESIEDDQEKVKVFWPDGSTHQSLADQVEEDSTMAEFTVKYGLTYIDGVNAKLHFIHRTFAEYLFAQYLFQGFILDDTKHNRLLDREAVRRLIVSDVWVRDEYNGVRFFFDAMLKNLIESKEWRNRIGRRTGRLPDRLLEIFRDKNLRFFSLQPSTNYSAKRRYRTLTTTVVGRHKNIFAFLCDGLNLTMDRVSLRKLMRYTFDDHFYLVEQEDYYAQCSVILKRRLGYCEGMKEVKATLIQMMHDEQWSSVSKLKYTQTDQEERRNNLKIALDFMGKHRDTLKKLQKKNNSDLNKFKSEMLEVLILNGYYASLTKQYLEILSFLYIDNDSSFAVLLNAAIATCFGKSANSNETIKDFLPTLKDLGRTNVVDRISYLILKWHPTVFEHFYLPPLQEDENMSDSADIQLLLARDLGGMTRLHRAAFHGDLEVSTRLLNKVNDSFVRGNPENKKMAKVVIDYYMARDDSGLTPLHIAATRGHQKVVRVTLEFFKKILSDHKLRKDLTKTDGILNKIMKDAITHKNYDMFRLVLKSVKQFLGQGYVLDLLRSLNTAYHDATFLEIIAEVQGDSKGYEFLQNLVFKEKIQPRILRQLGHQILVGMLTVKGWNDGVKRLLDYNLEEGFYTLAQLCEKLENHQVSQIVNAIILPNNGTSSYWAKWLSQEIAGQGGEGGPMLKSINCYKYLVKWIWIHLGESTLRDVLVQDDCKPVIRVLLECFDENPIYVALAYLSDGIRKEVGVRIIKYLCPTMRDMFIDSHFVPETDVYIIWMNVLELITDYANERQLAKFVNTISHKHDFGGTRRNIWSVFFDYSGTVENMLDKLEGFFKCLSEKLGDNILKYLLLQNEAQTITRALLRQKGLSIDLALAYLSEESKSEVRKSIIDSLPQTMENLILDQESDSLPPGLCPVFEMWSDSEKSLCFDWTIMLELLVDYADKSQLAKFVKFILSYNFSNGNCMSVWGEWFAERHDPQTFRKILDTFLGCVSEKLGSETVKDLLLHEGKNGFIIRRAAELDGILELIMLIYLSDEHEMDVKRLIGRV